jgi:large subunit ribosomal protein L24
MSSRTKHTNMKILKGDRVVVLSGKDKGVEGVVERAIPDKGKVIVDGVNVAKKHQAPTRGDQQGGIIDKAMPIDVSNVAIVSPKDGKATRVGYRIDDDGAKVRICRRTGAEL